MLQGYLFLLLNGQKQKLLEHNQLSIKYQFHKFLF